MIKREFSAGAVIFRREDEKIFYLLLHYHFKGDYWDFPRGNIEKGETADQTAAREIKEETGIDSDKNEFKIINGFLEKSKWFYQWNGKKIMKQAKYFLAETKKEDVKISEEHLEFKWLEFDDALKQLTYNNSKRVLKAAHKFLQRHSSIKKFLK